jgi:acyl carrier protein
MLKAFAHSGTYNSCRADNADMHMKTELRQFIVDNFLYGRDDNTLGDNISFLEKGIIDSTGILELVSFIEDKYGITIEDEELIPDNFDSLTGLSVFISRKTGNGNNH